jgi:hypothetical protein
MVTPADVLATLGCVWAAATASSPTPHTAHIDLWWQPAGSLDDARQSCADTPRCTGVWWNERDAVYRRLSGAVSTSSARGDHADAYSVHTNACDVATFRDALVHSNQDVVFVVTTVPRKGWGRYKGKKYFAAHLDTTLTQAPTVPIIYVQGDDASSDEATRIVGAAHGDGDENGKGNTPGVPRPVLYVRPPPWPEHRWKPPTKKHTHPKWFAKENWHWSWSVLLAHFAGEGIGKGCEKEDSTARTSDDDLTAIGSSGCGGPRVGFLEDDVILAQNAMTVLGDLPVKPPDDVLGVSLWDADDKPLWHRCFNCYSKAIVYERGDALTLGTHVREHFWAAPVDWLVDDYGRDVLKRYNRCLVPNLAEHIGDISSNGVDRSWQKSPNFTPTARRSKYRPVPVPDYPVRDR